MIVDLKPDIRNALIADAGLVADLGGERVYSVKAPDGSVYPRITMFDVYNLDRDFADDVAISNEVRVQIDVWSKENYNAIVAKVDDILHQQLGFRRYYATDLYEEKDFVYHKVLRYSIIKEV